jgi:hypothetical protein
MIIRTIAFLFFLFGISACDKNETPEVIQPPQKKITVTYGEDTSNIPNPERGYFSQTASYSTSQNYLTQDYIDKLKAQNITLVRRVFVMNTFRDSEISAGFLQQIQADLDMLRKNGFKIILRFAYTFNETQTSSLMQDAPLERVLAHIDQLAPVIQKNADVIALMEGGFIGKWGEWHSSTNGLATVDNMRKILFKTLEVLPKNRMVSIRYLWAKQDIYNTEDPLPESEAFTLTNRARTGHHNECFVASTDNWGTYWPIDDTNLNIQKDYLNKENRFLPQVGETCNCNPPGSDCPEALKELARMRWSAINIDYIDCVVDGWKNQGCYEEIAKKLGYRFVLLKSEFPSSTRRDSMLNFSILIRNDGFASPYNQRDLELVFKSVSTGITKRLKLNSDPRRWLPDLGNIEIKEQLNVSSLSPDEYDLYLNLPDPEKSLNTNPAYSIRIANTGTWDDKTGYNNLGVKIKIAN